MVAVFFFFQNPDRKESKLTTKEKIQQMDILGAGFLISAIVCLLLALQVSLMSLSVLVDLINCNSGEVSFIHGATRKSGDVYSDLVF